MPAVVNGIKYLVYSSNVRIIGDNWILQLGY